MLKKYSLFLVLLSGVFWGSSPLFVNHLISLGYESLQTSAIRLILAAPMMHICLLVTGKQNYKIPLKSIKYLFLCGIGSVLTMCICYFYAMTLTTAAVSAVLLYTAPIFVMIMSIIFFKERFTGKKCTALILAVLGCALTSGIIGGISGSILGVLIGLLSGFAYSLYGIISTFAIKQGVTPIACTAFSFTFAAIAAFFITDPIELISDIKMLSSSPVEIIMLPLFSLFTAVIPFILYTVGLKNVKPDVAAIAASTEPVVCALFGTFVLSQGITVFQIIGIVLVIMAIIILNVKTNKKRG